MRVSSSPGCIKVASRRARGRKLPLRAVATASGALPCSASKAATLRPSRQGRAWPFKLNSDMAEHLFRQGRRGDWAGVVDQVRQALGALRKQVGGGR